MKSGGFCKTYLGNAHTIGYNRYTVRDKMLIKIRLETSR